MPANARSAPSTIIPQVGSVGTVVDHLSDFRFQGGEIEYELRQDGDRVVQIARNHYMVPMMIHWEISGLQNLEPTTAMSGCDSSSMRSPALNSA